MVDLMGNNKEAFSDEDNGDGGCGEGPRQGARRDGGPFPCQSDITVGPYKASIAIDTGEATIVYGHSGPRASSWESFDDGWDWLVSDAGELLAKRPSLTEEEREARNLERANKRAIVALRRYCVRNDLQKMLTLTYAEESWDRAAVKRDMNLLFVRWRRLKGGGAFPYAYVLELHPSGHGLHVHVAVPLRYIDKHWLQETWGHGIVHYRDPKPLRERNSRERSRRLSGYLAKYVSKDMSSDHVAYEQRYSVAQGFNFEVKRSSFNTLVEARAWILLFRGEHFNEVWSYADDENWDGPPVWVFRSPGKLEGR
ncbi:MAG: hypothetical protein ABSC34_12320 [Acidimicrobiales bacterium]